MIQEGHFYIKKDVIYFQRAEYIEDGWFVRMTKEDITLFEIPYGGGEPVLIGVYDELLDAIQAGERLT